MPCGREIWLRHVKCALRVKRFISFHFPRKRKISQCPMGIISYPKDISRSRAKDIFFVAKPQQRAAAPKSRTYLVCDFFFAARAENIYFERESNKSQKQCSWELILIVGCKLASIMYIRGCLRDRFGGLKNDRGYGIINVKNREEEQRRNWYA